MKKIDNVPLLGHTIHVLMYGPARNEILTWPTEIKRDFGAILTKIQKGQFVGFPDTRPMKTVAAGCFELRMKGKEGAFRAFYVIRAKQGILIFHCFKKKSRKTALQEIKTGQKRLSSFLKELENETKT